MAHAMFQFEGKPTGRPLRKACLRAHKMLDQPTPGFRQWLRKLWALEGEKRASTGQGA